MNNVFSLSSDSDSKAIFERFCDRPDYTCSMYLEAGMQVTLDMFIDFTESNLKPNDPASLHYMGSLESTEYEKAISAVTKILKECIPTLERSAGMFGFGAYLRTDNSKVSQQCFPLCEGPVEFGQAAEVYRRSFDALDLGCKIFLTERRPCSAPC